MNAMQARRFSKMQGAGNDFVILDRRGLGALDASLAVRLADRHYGVGCDQVITIEDPTSADALARYGVWNPDGSTALQCGNGARCVAAWLRRDGAATTNRFGLESPAGRVEAEIRADGSIAIQMGVPAFEPIAIGLRVATQADPYDLQIGRDHLHFGAVAIGNPHAVLEVNDVAKAEVGRIAALLQPHRLFAASCNVGFAQIVASDRIRLRVHERGAGETLACGSGACAAVAVLARRGRLGREVAVELPGGTLQIFWAGAGEPIWMAGPAEFVFEGEFIA
jgi:diaminopimelate epimerase